MSIIQDNNKPAELPVTIEDRNALIGQYIRHVDSAKIFKITEVGRDGVTVDQVKRFGDAVIPSTTQFMITWASLKYKHRIMVHVADVDIKPEHLQ
jgi:hypothetical protein